MLLLTRAHISQDIVRRAKRRIFLSSLYLASEHQLVRVLASRVPPLTRVASVPRHRTAPEQPSPPPPHPRLQPLNPARPGLPRPRPPPPRARPCIQGPRLPLSQPLSQRPRVHPRPPPLQRGLGDLAPKNIRGRRRRHHQRVSLPVLRPIELTRTAAPTSTRPTLPIARTATSISRPSPRWQTTASPFCS